MVTEKRMRQIISEEIKKADEKRIKEIVADTIEEFFKLLWQRNNFWKNGIK